MARGVRAPRSTSTPQAMPITLIENFRAAFYAPFYAAAALGAYEAEGVDVRIEASPDAAKTMQTLISGGGDVSWGGPLRLMEARERRPANEPIVFCEVVGRDPFFLIGRERERAISACRPRGQAPRRHDGSAHAVAVPSARSAARGTWMPVPLRSRRRARWRKTQPRCVRGKST